MNLEILLPFKKIEYNNIKYITVPGEKGYFSIYQNHSNIIAIIGVGILKIKYDNNIFVNYEVNFGILKVCKNQIMISVNSLYKKNDT
ncbi:MAG: F0F1 ATP synthase subunit epsilon [Bacteroides sp.]|nr:MAG: F0F1 ATP synthase subunit epsilon [Bacteroides sp.]